MKARTLKQGERKIGILPKAPVPTPIPTTGPTQPTAVPIQPIVAPTQVASSLDTLVTAAKREGQLNVIALPHDWCDYGDVISQFKAKYGLNVNELNPDAASGDEVQAIIANKGNTGPQAPDVIDVGMSWGAYAKAQGLLAPYKVSRWSTIPDSVKDADGYWYGDYYGVLVFEVNSDLIKTSPQDWSDLLKPNYKNAIALAGDPRVSNQAIQGVYAAGLSTGAKTAADAGTAGLNFLAQLNKAGNFVPTTGKAASLAQGATPIVIRWDYLSLADADTLKGNPKIATVVPKSGIVAGIYLQAISAYAPHPNAAKLWMEYLYSDEGQLTWLKGYCHPIRYNDLVKNNKIPADLAAKLPPADAYARAIFLSVDDQNAVKEVITKQWDAVVGVNVK